MMKQKPRPVRIGWVSLLLVVLVVGPSLAEDAREQAISPESVIRLFDGESLDGLYTWMKESQYEDPDRVFRVTDGMLHITGEGFGGILTKKEYRDYHCILEMKWGPRTWGSRNQSISIGRVRS